jgi:hypothetical protein
LKPGVKRIFSDEQAEDMKQEYEQLVDSGMQKVKALKLMAKKHCCHWLTIRAYVVKRQRRKRDV